MKLRKQHIVYDVSSRIIAFDILKRFYSIGSWHDLHSVVSTY